MEHHLIHRHKDVKQRVNILCGRQRIVSIDFHSCYIVIVCIIRLVVWLVEVASAVERKLKYFLPIQGEFILSEKLSHLFLQNFVFNKII